jgi:mono/diheme cytochrome c family protein
MAMACNMCHTGRGEAFEHSTTKPGPDLAGIGTRHSAADLLESLLNPDGRSLMPDYRDRLTVRQLTDLVAYLQSLHGNQDRREPVPGARLRQTFARER